MSNPLCTQAPSMTKSDEERMKMLSDDIYSYVFQLLEGESDLTGANAGHIATLLKNGSARYCAIKLIRMGCILQSRSITTMSSLYQKHSYW